jgi:cyclic-di-GMP phosphodiesterase, flagellum assembly factor TipF
MRLGVIFIAVCMAIIAGSTSAFLYLFVATSVTEAVTAGVAIFTALVLGNWVSSRVGLQTAVDRQLADLARAGADVARQVAEINRRLGALESSVDSTLARTRTATDPLALEIGELGTLVKQLAETVASHQSALASTVRDTAPAGLVSAKAAPARPASAESVSSASPPQVKACTGDDVPSSIRAAIETNRLDLYLQPIVTLPQRKVRYYEAMSRLHTEGGDLLPGADFIPQAESGGLMPQIDSLAIFRCIQVLRRLLLKNRDIGLFCNLSRTTLTGLSFSRFLEFMQANRAIAPSLVLEFSQRAVRTMGAAEHEGLAALFECGFRFSLDNVMDLRIEPRELAGRGFRFIKVRSDLLLDRTPPAYPPALAGEAGELHPADLPDLLSRFGIELIAEKIESEDSVIDLLDHDVRYGQGFLFSPPRPVRAEALQGISDRSDGVAQEPADEGSPDEAQRSPGPAVPAG